MNLIIRIFVNLEYQAFVLNFNGRVEQPSVKNFQLVEESNGMLVIINQKPYLRPNLLENKVLLQFGRVDKNSFNMDFQWPLSPFQAFAICLSSFDYKFACE